MIEITDICFVVYTCQRYHTPRLKIQIDTFLKDIPKQQLIIFSDVETQFLGFKTIELLRSSFSEVGIYKPDMLPFFMSMSVLLSQPLKYYVLICDDDFVDIPYLIQKMQILEGVQYIYAGMPLYQLCNGYRFNYGWASGGNIRIFNQKSLGLINTFSDISSYINLLPPQYKSDFEFTTCDDVATGFIFQQNGITLENIYNQPLILIMTQTFPNVSDCKKYIDNNKQVGYHFLYHSCPMPIQFQNKYFQKMMHYAYKLSKERQ